ncbi:MAG TPA: ABC transporter permease [Candidatus Limnocylindrales bacterium]|nr:ABC transporter permease [Candidatus Limnocylindrales bacterium]
MTRFILRRLLSSIPVIIGIVFLVFALARIIPGDPCEAALGERANEVTCERYAVAHGLDKAIIPGIFRVPGGAIEARPGEIPATFLDNQFVVFVGDVVSGDFGTSSKFGLPVTDLLIQRLPTTVELTLYALTFAIIAGILLGVMSAWRRNSFADVFTMLIANIGVSTPVFVLGLSLAYLFAIVLGDTALELPPSYRLSPGTDVPTLAATWGLEDLGGPLRSILDFMSNIYTFNAIARADWALLGDVVRHMILPAFALGTIPLAIIARITRSSLLDELGLDYIRTARAKGLRDRAVVLRHGLRNAMLPVVTVIGLQLGSLFGGAVLTETIFNLAGVGRAVTEAILSRDYAVIQGFTLVIAIGFVLINLLVDLSYAFLDPRVQQR